jgi:hypothetical protein
VILPKGGNFKNWYKIRNHLAHSQGENRPYCDCSCVGGYKEILSILSDQQRPSYMSPNAGGGGVAGSQPMRTAAHIT